MAAKYAHEIRDPVHVFIRHDSDERKVINSRPVQRLRYIHQLALSYLVYPGVTHRRFEHSLGAMALAGRVFDVITNPHNVTDQIRDLVPEIADEPRLPYWRQMLRMAALCHDIGHLPFSHAAEHALLPDGWNHERLTRELILSEEMASIWEGMRPRLAPEDLVKLAVGPGKATDLPFSSWERILCEVVVSNAFGADRMDYLLRDSHHAGVAYGHFDHHRLIDSLRVLQPPAESGSVEPALGVDEGGLHSAEALLLARYFMFSQMYFHPIRQVYDLHLQDFLSAWLDGGTFSIEVGDHLQMTDNEVTVAMADAARGADASGHDPARRIMQREHYKVLYQRKPDDLDATLEPGYAVFLAAQERFGADSVKHKREKGSSGAVDFPVLQRDGSVVGSLVLSAVLRTLPRLDTDYVFIEPGRQREALAWLAGARKDIISQATEAEEE